MIFNREECENAQKFVDRIRQTCGISSDCDKTPRILTKNRAAIGENLCRTVTSEMKRFVGDCALADDIRRAGQIKAADGEVLAVDIHIQRTAGNIDLDMLAADRALERQNR